ncbi:MAG: glycoside hydrolase family 3 C-terminal domain-containing protein, partial [bacterium]
MSTRTETLLQEMTRVEKVALVGGHDLWNTVGIERLGIPALKVTDGPNGARGESFSGRTAACFPCGTALASTWDIALVERVGEALAEEARAKGARMLLAPTVNIHRTLVAGRNFECFSEDPFLASRMAVAYIRGVQSRRVSVCVKHFVCNDQEFERMTISAELEDRALREIYLPPFEAAVKEAGARGVMSAYNRIRGTYACENKPLLRDILRGEYGFEGVVVSDWFGTQSTAEALQAGLDLEMPGPPRRRGEVLAKALEAGEVEESDLDAAVGNLLDLLEWTGALDEGGPEEETSSDGSQHRELLVAASAGSMVLLKNEAKLLPLAPDSLRRVAVLGPNAALIEPQGGGSAQVALGELVSPLDAIRERLGTGVDVVYQRGCDIHRALPALRTPAVIDYFEGHELEGESLARDEVRRLHFTWLGVPTRGVSQAFSARVRTEFVAEESGTHSLGLVSAGRSRLFVDGNLVVDNWTKQESGTAFFGMGSKEVHTEIELEAGRSCAIVVEYSALQVGGLGGLTIGCLPPRPDDLLERAVSAAADADLAILVVGSNPDWESEGRDRKSIDLPGRQIELIEKVAAVNPQTIVVVNAGSPLEMSWADTVPAVVQLWYPGQEGAQALAEVLCGDRDPGGRL